MLTLMKRVEYMSDLQRHYPYKKGYERAHPKPLKSIQEYI